MIIIKYETEEEGKQIITEKSAAGYTLVAVQNVTEGNFLGFQEPGWVPPEPETPLLDKINDNTEYLIDIDYRLSLVELGLI